jgi:hypothetical protein
LQRIHEKLFEVRDALKAAASPPRSEPSMAHTCTSKSA